MEMERDEGVRGSDLAKAGLTRGKVAGMLGVSVATVRRMEGKTLHPRQVDGTWRFDPDEVARIHPAEKPSSKRSTPQSAGDLASDLFHRFDQGQDLRAIVEELHLPPEQVRSLYQEWATPLGESPGTDDGGINLYDDDRDLERWETRMREMMEAEDTHAQHEREARRSNRRPIRSKSR